MDTAVDYISEIISTIYFLPIQDFPSVGVTQPEWIWEYG